jgi:hypothetical protein
MRVLSFISIFISLVIGVSAQTPAKIGLQNSAPGKITLTRNKTRAIVDLSKDVAGCAYVPAAVKKAANDCGASPAEFTLLDATVKNNESYLLIVSDAAGNCNVCGQCGATEAFGLIWLKLDRNLRLLDKKSVPIDFCRGDIEAVGEIIDFNEETQDATLKLAFNGDVLAVDFEKTIFGEGASRSYEFSHLEYNRKTPEKGFVIKTEKRERSSVPEQ